MIRLICASTVVWLAGVVLTGWALAAPAAPGVERRWDFQGDAVGSSPAGFSFDRTGEGRAGKWAIEVDPTAPSGDHVLAQLDRDVTDHRFPVAVADAPALRDVRAEVRCKPVSGEVDRACGLVVRYRDARNYYVARANALEGNVNLYRVVDGRRQQIKGGRGASSSGTWHALALEARGDRLQVFWDGKPIIDATDDTFREAGKVGVWTKADSVTLFDALSASPLP
jgi:hypothetical protein